MAALTIHQFGHWLEMYGKASKENDPQASADLFALDASYHETPFDKPIRANALHWIACFWSNSMRMANAGCFANGGTSTLWTPIPTRKPCHENP